MAAPAQLPKPPTVAQPLSVAQLKHEAGLKSWPRVYVGGTERALTVHVSSGSNSLRPTFSGRIEDGQVRGRFEVRRWVRPVMRIVVVFAVVMGMLEAAGLLASFLLIPPGALTPSGAPVFPIPRLVFMVHAAMFPVMGFVVTTLLEWMHDVEVRVVTEWLEGLSGQALTLEGEG